jgi:endonuclease G
MTRKTLRILSAVLATAAAVFTVVGGTSAKRAGVNPHAGPVPQASVSPHLTLGNPSNATAGVRNKNNYLLVKPQFALSYNNARGAPNWVSWHLEASDIGDVERQNDFHPEPDLPRGFKRVTPTDYLKTGFDQGHMCNSKDRSTSEEDNSATFSMANMQPQTADLNRQVWKRLEDFSREIVGQGNELYIVAGCYGGRKTIGKANKVTVPAQCWKVIVVLPEGRNDLSRVDENTRVIAVIMPNKAGISHDPWTKYIKTVRQVEAATGYNFLSEVPRRIQDVIETRRDAGE